MADERTSLFGNQRAQNSSDTCPHRFYRYRRYERSHFHYYICAVILALLFIVLAIAILDSSTPIDSDDVNENDMNSTFPAVTMNDTNFLLLMTSQEWPINDEEPMIWTLPPPTIFERNLSLDAGISALGKRELFEENLKTVPLYTPSYKHQRAVSTTADARKLSKRGYVENHATLDYAKRKSFKKSQGRQSIGQGPSFNLDVSKKNDKLQCDSHLKYRHPMGKCNSRKFPFTYGVAYTPFRRILNPDYADGISEPRASHFSHELPSAREVSLFIHRPSYSIDPNFTVMLAVFGQFLDHDITATALNQGQDGETIDCCYTNAESHPECFPVKLGHGDPNYDLYNVTCMNFIRSAAAPTDHFGPRQQLNQASAYIDGSVVYGSTDEKVHLLRTNKNGLLRMFLTPDNRTLLPVSTDPSDGCNDKEQNANGKYCFESGDTRANENLHLTSMHLIWARHHNYIANSLKQLNSHWNDEKLFQESRKILGAQLQHITYNEFLPVVLGKNISEQLGLSPKTHKMSDTYDVNINPTIANVFAACAFRFAHTLLPGLMNATRDIKSPAAIPLHKMLFNPYSLWTNNGLDNAIGGAILTPLAKSDQFFTNELTEKLFIDPYDDKNEKFSLKKISNKCGLDLVSLNIQRGRDHGLPAYFEWRKLCKLPATDTWENLSMAVDGDSFESLRKVFKSVKDIDIYTGALSEPPLSGSIVGPLLSCLISDQFVRLKKGDSHWYERNRGAQKFTSRQLKQIYGTTLAGIICRNSDRVNESQRYVMRKIDSLNPILNCIELDTFQFAEWKELASIKFQNDQSNVHVLAKNTT